MVIFSAFLYASISAYVFYGADVKLLVDELNVDKVLFCLI